MRNKLILIITLITISSIVHFFFNKTPIHASERIFIQGSIDSLVLKDITQALAEKINNIIKEELNLDENYAFKFFLTPRAQKITLYYVNDLQGNANDILISTLDHIKPSTFLVHNTSIGDNVEFFYGPFGEKDELVIMINDPNKELSFLNQFIKEAMHQANDKYKQIHHKNLYDITKSEEYPYIPHLGLGSVEFLKTNF